MNSRAPVRPCQKCGKQVEGTRHQGGGFTGGKGPIPKDAPGWDFECQGPHNGSEEAIKWFVPDDSK